MKSWITILIIVLFTAASSALLNACKKKDVAKNNAAPTKINFDVPPGFPQPKYNFAGNPLTKEGVELGRKLFYDGRLSKDGNFPCASCHQQFAAFATFDHDLSHGFDNAFTTRNAPALYNLAWQSEFHHDGGINNIELQPLAPLTATNEMAETVESVINKLKQDAQYKDMFRAAYGDETINSQRMLKALAQFSLTLVSANSKYDKVKRGEAFFTSPEQSGYAVFQAKCASCHVEPLFTDFSYRNIGLPVNTYFNDYGRMRITNDKLDSLKFKVPSLRNVALTFPYMHDGRFSTIQDCLNHYRNGMVQSPSFDPSLGNRIALSNLDVNNIVAFLKTLTDSSFIKDPRFAQP